VEELAQEDRECRCAIDVVQDWLCAYGDSLKRGATALERVIEHASRNCVSRAGKEQRDHSSTSIDSISQGSSDVARSARAWSEPRASRRRRSAQTALAVAAFRIALQVWS